MARNLTLVSLCAWALTSSPLLAQAPAPEQKKFEVFVSEWNFEGESKAVPALGMTDAGKVSYRHVNQMANGGFFSRRVGPA